MIDIRTAIEKFFNKPIQDEKAINEFILDIQKEMLKADVDVKFVFEFSNQLRESLKQKPNKYTLTKIIYEKLENILGKALSA
jgi:signal recognition particle subunit SRP54